MILLDASFLFVENYTSSISSGLSCMHIKFQDFMLIYFVTSKLCGMQKALLFIYFYPTMLAGLVFLPYFLG